MHFCVLRRNSRWPLNMAGKRFLGKVVSRLYWYTGGKKFQQNRTILHHFRDKCVFAFYAEIHDAYKNDTNDFWEKSPVDSADTLGVKTFNKIVHRNSRWLPKMAGKRFLEKVTSQLWRYPSNPKFQRNCSITYGFRDKCVFAFYAEIPDDHQKWRQNDFWEKSPVNLVWNVTNVDPLDI